MGYLPDTNVFIEILRGRNQRLRERLAGEPLDNVKLSAVVLGELMVAIEKGAAAPQRIALGRLKDIHTVAPIDTDAALAYARVRADLERRGLVIGANDMWIAAQALAHDLTLVTANTREFSRVSGLKIVNWQADAET